MRQLWCDECGRTATFIIGNAPIHVGTYEAYAASPEGEPAEWVRVVKGRTRMPTPLQRTMFVNGAAFPLEPDRFTCDNCNGDVLVGAPAWCVTVWQPAMRLEPPAWEQDYLDIERGE